MAGTDGIDYSSPEERYTLRSLPGRRFAGLQLLCMISNASNPPWTRAFPLTTNTGMPWRCSNERSTKACDFWNALMVKD